MKGQRDVDDDNDDVELNYSVRWETPLEFLKKTHLLLEIFISLRVVSLEKLSGKSLSWLMLIIIEIKGVILIKMNEGQFFVISRWNMIHRVSIIVNRTVVVDSDWRTHLQSRSKLYHVNWWYFKNSGNWPYKSIMSRCYCSSISYAVMVLDVIGAFRLMPSTNVIQLTLTLKMTTAQSLSTKVLFRTTFTRTIMLHLFMKWLRGSNISQSFAQ